MSAPNSPKTKRGANGKFLPKPLLFHLRHPNSKINQSKFWQILSPKNSVAKTSSALFRHLPEYLEGRTPKKNVLSTFKKNFTPAKSEMQGTFFFGVAERSEAVAERYERTRQFQATTRFARAISRNQDYQQNTFEPDFQFWRRGRDSNPRGSCPPNILAGCCFRPLSHLSKFKLNYNVFLPPLSYTPFCILAQV